MFQLGRPIVKLRSTPRLLGEGPRLGQRESCCVRTNADGTQQIVCADPPWMSSPGIYPGYPACGGVPSGGLPPGSGVPPGTGVPGSPTPPSSGPAPTSPTPSAPTSPGSGGGVAVCPKGGGRYGVVAMATGQILANDIDGAGADQLAAQYGGGGQVANSCDEPMCAPFCGQGGGSTPPPAPGGSALPGAPAPVTPTSGGGALPTAPMPGVPPLLPPIPGGTPPRPYEPPGPQVLPAPNGQTYETTPTGAWPGSPFGGPTSPPSPVRVVQQPAPPMPFVPPACPTGPVPLRMWAEGCAASKLS